MKLKIVAQVLVAVGLCVAGTLAYGASQWQRRVNDVRAKMEAARLPIAPAIYDAREIESLPAPVQRYFRAVLRDGRPVIAFARVSQQGQLRQRDAEPWRSFDATEILTTRPPSFSWDARMTLFPGIRVFVQDAYAAGTGSLRAALLGLISVADLRGTSQMAKGELQRYLAEAPWYPTALLPSQGVRWEAINDSSARASLTDGQNSVSIDFRFDQQGLIRTAWTQSRYRTVNGGLEATPWQGHFSAYAQRAGMRVPLESEVEWLLPTGPASYWRGRITHIDYAFAP